MATPGAAHTEALEPGRPAAAWGCFVWGDQPGRWQRHVLCSLWGLPAPAWPQAGWSCGGGRTP